MKNLFTLLFIFFASVGIIAQEQGIPAGGLGSDQGGFSGINFNTSMNQELLNKALGMTMGEDRELAYSQIKGSPYLNEEPVKGTLVMGDGKQVNDILLHIDLYTNEFIATPANGDKVLLDKTVLGELVIPTDEETVVLKKLDLTKPDQFYEVLYKDEKLLFYKQRYVTLREGSSQGMSKVDPKFNQRSRYFIKHGNKPAETVKLKKKDILAGFSKREQKALTKYAKSQKIKFKKEKNYIAIFEGFHNQ